MIPFITVMTPLLVLILCVIFFPLHHDRIPDILAGGLREQSKRVGKVLQSSWQWEPKADTPYTLVNKAAERLKVGPGDNPQCLYPSNLLPSSRLHLLKVLQLLTTELPALD